MWSFSGVICPNVWVILLWCCRRVTGVFRCIYTVPCSGSSHLNYSTPCHELEIYPGGWEKPHLLHFGKVDRASWWMEDAEEVTAVREVRSAWPFFVAFW